MKKFVRIINTVVDENESFYEVESFDEITYDSRGVLKIGDVIAPEGIVYVLFGSGTWKYIEIIEREVEDEQEEEEK